MNKFKGYKIEIVTTTIIILILVSFLITSKSAFSNLHNSEYTNTASLIMNHKIFDATNHVRNIIILIPNEAHESPTLLKEKRLIDQSYIPEIIELSVGTTVMWLNGDVAHEHKITLVDERSIEIFDSGVIAFGNLSNPLILNESGEFSYYESNVNEYDPNFTSRGTIDVRENNNTYSHSGLKLNFSTSNNKTIDTIGFLMMPTNEIKTHASKIENSGVDILDTYTFQDLLDDQNRMEHEQILLVMGTNSKAITNLSNLMTTITDALPYS